jgi:peptidylprolyl isomerase
MPSAKSGDTVKVHYTGKLKDGTVFDSSSGREPLQFTLGNRNMIEGFESAVFGMNAGDVKSVEIPADKAYGPRRSELVLEVKRSEVPSDVQPQIGQQLAVQAKDGRRIPVTVTSVTADKIILDANHSLAGKDLIFEINLVEIL